MTKFNLAAAAVAMTMAAGAGHADDPNLTIFDWSGYEDPNFFSAYVEEHGDTPTFSFFGDLEGAFLKLRSGFKADLAHPCSYSIPKWAEAGLLEPLDVSRIDRWDDLNRDFRDMDLPTADGKPYFLPIEWGNTALTYNTEFLTEEDVASLQVFANPEHAGRVSVGDNVYDAYALGFLAVGVTDWSTATDEDFRAASDFLRKVHPNVRDYWSSGASLAQLMQSGEVYLAWAWNETYATLSASDIPIKMKRDTEEGSSSWVCGYAPLANAPGSKDKAYDFLNAWLEPQSAEYMVKTWAYGHSNAKAVSEMDQEIVAAAGLDSSEELLNKRLLQTAVDPEMQEKMVKEFELIRAGF